LHEQEIGGPGDNYTTHVVTAPIPATDSFGNPLDGHLRTHDD